VVIERSRVVVTYVSSSPYSFDLDSKRLFEKREFRFYSNRKPGLRLADLGRRSTIELGMMYIVGYDTTWLWL
jgi:hypothetical protein